LFEEASNDDEDYDNLIYASRVVFDVAAHQTCQIAVDGYNGETGYIRLSVELGPLGRRGSAPKWALPDPNGVLVRSSSYVGKVMILNFWATWSELCSAEMADLVGLQEKYRNSGLVVVGANVSWSDDTTAAVRSFLATHVPAINYPIIMSTNNLEEPYRGVREIPATFIIDRDNDIRRTIVGQPSRATLEHAITPLLFNHMRLESRYSANHLVLRWPTNMIPFLLQSSKNPASGWTPWKGSVRVSSGTNTISVDMNGPPRFFRLQTAE
jgi:cytochrome c biogenesis protein CcmG/thiol:disulfide interchange protein DsbE